MNVFSAVLVVVGIELLIAAVILLNGTLAAAAAITCGLGLLASFGHPEPRP